MASPFMSPPHTSINWSSFACLLSSGELYPTLTFKGIETPYPFLPVLRISIRHSFHGKRALLPRNSWTIGHRCSFEVHCRSLCSLLFSIVKVLITRVLPSDYIILSSSNPQTSPNPKAPHKLNHDNDTIHAHMSDLASPIPPTIYHRDNNRRCQAASHQGQE